MRQCDNGHFYDETRYPYCPYCQQPGPGPMPGRTVAVGAGNPMNIGKTVAANVPGVNVDTGKTVGFIQKKMGLNPAVGFLIATTGPHKGADYKLVAGRNFIGRSASMDVSLPDDETISREGHAIVAYDGKHNTFTLTSGQSRGITYCNDEQIEGSCTLSAYDVIEVGSTKLVFLPFCGDRFQWNEEE